MSGQSARSPLTSQGLKEDEDRAKDHRNAASYGTDSIRGSLRLGNQIEQREAHDQENDEPLDPLHVGLVILSGLHRLFEHPAACTGRSVCAATVTSLSLYPFGQTLRPHAGGVYKGVSPTRCSGSYVMIINRDQTAGVPLPDLALGVRKPRSVPAMATSWRR
jgi:hypothetical protein